MLHTKFLGNRPCSSQVLEKKIFEGFLPYMGVAAILVMWSLIPIICPPPYRIMSHAVGTHLNYLAEAILIDTYNICLYW